MIKHVNSNAQAEIQILETRMESHLSYVRKGYRILRTVPPPGLLHSFTVRLFVEIQTMIYFRQNENLAVHTLIFLVLNDHVIYFESKQVLSRLKMQYA